MSTSQILMEIIAIGGAALVGSTIAAITGFGGAAVLLPVLVYFFGVRDAIPTLTVAQLIGNGSLVHPHWPDIHHRHSH